jgi:hydrogenase-4 component B
LTTGLALTAVGLTAASGPAAACARRAGPEACDWIAAALLGAGALFGAVAAVLALAGHGDALGFEAALPGGALSVGIDALSALFFLPAVALTAACGAYALAYYPAASHAREAGRLRVAFGLMSAGLLLVLLARHALVFLVAWEVMAVAAFFAVTADDRDPAVRDAGFLYLVCTRLGTLCLFALFGLLWSATGSLTLQPLAPGQTAPGIQSALFALALVGFGMKAGLVPLHVWLPPAHAAAPTHVSAFLSGVLIKSGIYGIVRIASLLPDLPAWCGELLLFAGVSSAVLGVAFALAQHDVKRLLAYHSVENIGIIAIGMGLALLARATGRAEIAALALAGALLHVVNHALFKALLFLAAGAVIQRAHTRSLDALGGLARWMPRTALLFLVGAVAIVGLPPLNGFVSEFLVYSALLRTAAEATGRAWIAAAVAVPALALTGGLALACFAKVVGAVFLGAPRSAAAEHGADPPAAMLAAMTSLALLCAAIGLAPQLAAPALASASAVGLAAPVMAIRAPLGAVAFIAVTVLGLCAVLWLLLRGRLERAPAALSVTWDCGYAVPTGRMQYSAASFADLLVRAFALVLWPRVRAPQIRGLFPGRSEFHSEVPDGVLDRLLLPALDHVGAVLARLRVLQQGSVQAYLLYVWIALVALFAATGVTR